MSGKDSVYWDDLAEDLKDPEFLRTYVLESVRIKTIDSIINQIDDAREAAQLTKAALARAISTEPAAIRRLLGASTSNPTLGTVSELAAALGFRLTLERLPGSGGDVLSSALIAGATADPKRLLTAVEDLDRDDEPAHC